MGNNEFSTLQMSMTVISFHKLEEKTTERVTAASLNPQKMITVKMMATSSSPLQKPGNKTKLSSRGSEGYWFARTG